MYVHIIFVRIQTIKVVVVVVIKHLVPDRSGKWAKYVRL